MPTTARTGTARLASVAILLMGALMLAAVPAQAGSASRHRLSRDEAEVMRIIDKAGRGDAHAQAMLGFMYANGRGVPQSYDKAVDWYLQAAEQGDPYGQYLLGLMYDKGFGVNPDVIVAHKWLNLAAAHAPRQDRENFLRMRDAVGSKMTPDQLDIAHKLAADFIPARPW